MAESGYKHHLRCCQKIIVEHLNKRLGLPLPKSNEPKPSDRIQYATRDEDRIGHFDLKYYYLGNWIKLEVKGEKRVSVTDFDSQSQLMVCELQSVRDGNGNTHQGWLLGEADLIAQEFGFEFNFLVFYRQSLHDLVFSRLSTHSPVVKSQRTQVEPYVLYTRKPKDHEAEAGYENRGDVITYVPFTDIITLLHTEQWECKE